MTSGSIKDIIFWGATGQAKVLRECVGKKYNLLAIFDNDKNKKSPFKDVPIYHNRSGFEKWIENKDPKSIGFLVAIGGDSGVDRMKIHEYLESFNLESLIAKHPTSFVSDDVTVGKGSQILCNSSVCVETIVGKCCIINTGASVDHECQIGDGTHICPGAHLAGLVEIGKYSTVYTGAIILPRLKIGEGVIIGAGTIVRHDVPPYTTVVGNPERILRK